MVKVSMPFREVTRGSDPMKALQGNRTHSQSACQKRASNTEASQIKTVQDAQGVAMICLPH